VRNRITTTVVAIQNGPYKSGVSVHDVEKRRRVWGGKAGLGGPASVKHGGCVDVEELRVEGEGPEHVFLGGGGG